MPDTYLESRDKCTSRTLWAVENFRLEAQHWRFQALEQKNACLRSNYYSIIDRPNLCIKIEEKNEYSQKE